MDKQLFETLAELRIQERAIKDQIEEVMPKVLESVTDLEEGTVIDIGSGTFTVSHRRTWEYSGDYQAKAEELDRQKKEEQQKGIATYVTKPSVTFKEAA